MKFKHIELEATITAKGFYRTKKYKCIRRSICHGAVVSKMRKKVD